MHETEAYALKIIKRKSNVWKSLEILSENYLIPAITQFLQESHD